MEQQKMQELISDMSLKEKIEQLLQVRFEAFKRHTWKNSLIISH